MRWLWVGILGPMAVTAGLCWALLKWVMEREELAQWAGVAAVPVGVVAIAVTVWAALQSRREPAGGDDIDMKHIRAERAVKAKTGPTTPGGGDRIRMRRIRAGSDVIGKQTRQTRPPAEPTS